MPNRFHTNIYEISKQNVFDKYDINKFKFALFPKDDGVTWSIINGTQYEPYIFDFLVNNNIQIKGKQIIEIGANNGNFTIDFANYVGNKGKVHAFEPQRIIYYQLCGNVFMNGYDNVYCYNVAISNKSDVSKIEHPDYFSQNKVNFGNVRVDDTLKHSYDYVECRKLDTYDFENIVLIKIDTQGHEYFVLEGAEETIRKHRPYIILEIEKIFLDLYGVEVSSLYNLLNQYEYTCFQLSEGIPYSTSTGYCVDYVAIPNELKPENYIIP